MKKNYVLLSLALTLAFAAHSQKILFDCTKAQTAGNADWVVDADLHDLGWGSSGPYIGGSKSDPQRLPTPAQNTITNTTAENYWEGSLSSWGIDMVNQGFEVETLPYSGRITYGDNTNPQDLSNYKVYVVDEPNIRFTTAEKTAIVNFVQHGGGLYLISDHNNSDRNNDGWDSPKIWLDFANSTGNVFGIAADTVEVSPTIYTFPTLPNDSCLHGPLGSVAGLKYHQGTTFTISPSVNPTVVGIAYNSGTSGNTGVLAGHCWYGTGKVAFIGDSSPFDDGSGNPASTLYSSYATDVSGSHRKLIVNTTVWLAGGAGPNAITEVSASQMFLYPNPVGDILNVKSDELCTLEVFDISGQKVIETKVQDGNLNHLNVSGLSTGMYVYKLTGEKTLSTGKLIKK